MLLPMHLPVLLCGFLCGGGWGAAVGITAPLLRHLIFSMPPMPGCISMAFELAVYGAVSGFLYNKLPRKKLSIYGALLTAMLAGRLVWGAAMFICMGIQNSAFTFAAFIAGAFTNAIPGIVIQIVLIPLLVIVLEKLQNRKQND